MNAKVKLEDIVESLEFQSEETTAWLDRQTGEVHYIGPDEQKYLDDWDDDEDEDDDEFNDGDDEDVEVVDDLETVDPYVAIAKLIGADQSGRFVSLPTQYDVHEYRALEQFAHAQEDEKAANELARAIRGSGAFRYFKDTVHRLGLTDQWHAFRDQYYRDFARQWCEENGFSFE